MPTLVQSNSGGLVLMYACYSMLIDWGGIEDTHNRWEPGRN